jgi:hypothetical protein
MKLNIPHCGQKLELINGRDVLMEIIEKSWFKRRKPTQEPRPVDIRLDEFEQVHNHLCMMYVKFDNGAEAEFVARVIYNDMQDEWIVDAGHVAVRL